jgi:hypothetical protein
MWELRGSERIPIFHTIISPYHIRTIPHQLEADRREYIPPEGRRGGHRLTKPKRPGGHGSGRSTIGALWGARRGDHPEKGGKRHFGLAIFSQVLTCDVFEG